MDAVNDYLAGMPAPHRIELERIRTLVKKLVPDAQETISYGLPTFKYKSKPLLYYASFKNHMSIFPTPGPAEAVSGRLKAYKVSKGTIQFTIDHPLPDDLLKELVLLRRAEVEA